MKILLGLLAFALATTSTNAEDEVFENGFSAVDPVSIEVAEQRGKEIYERDQYAWKATDLVVEKGLLSGNHGIIGFLTDIRGKTARTYFFNGTNEAPKIAFAVKFKGKKKPKLEKRPKSSRRIINRFKARQLAFSAIDRYCTQNYNTVVLDDGDNYLVYALAATTQHNTIVLGGHYRFRVNKETLKLVKKERLSNGCLEMPIEAGNYPGTTHLVTDSPLETHTFLSHQHGTIYIITDTGAFSVRDGIIKVLDTSKDDQT